MEEKGINAREDDDDDGLVVVVCARIACVCVQRRKKRRESMVVVVVGGCACVKENVALEEMERRKALVRRPLWEKSMCVSVCLYPKMCLCLCVFVCGVSVCVMMIYERNGMERKGRAQ